MCMQSLGKTRCEFDHKIEEEEREEFGVRLGKLSRKKDYREVFQSKTEIVPFYVRIIGWKIWLN